MKNDYVKDLILIARLTDNVFLDGSYHIKRWYPNYQSALLADLAVSIYVKYILYGSPFISFYLYALCKIALIIILVSSFIP